MRRKLRKKLRKSIIKPITKSIIKPITQTSREKPGMTRLAGGKATGKSAHFSQKRNATGSAKRNRYAMIEKARKFTGFG
ncbi:hypothetical protein MOX73_005251 [Escherichia coli]|nr:hypothetical protein [Escherichia coli]EIY9738234.1 hypothetical protein [Escherichia coli]